MGRDPHKGARPGWRADMPLINRSVQACRASGKVINAMWDELRPLPLAGTAPGAPPAAGDGSAAAPALCTGQGRGAAGLPRLVLGFVRSCRSPCACSRWSFCCPGAPGCPGTRGVTLGSVKSKTRSRLLWGRGRAPVEASKGLLGFMNPGRDVPAGCWMGLGPVGAVPVPVLGRAHGVR